MQTKQIHFRISSEEHSFLKQQCEKRGISISECLLNAVQKFFIDNPVGDSNVILEDMQRRRELSHIREQNKQGKRDMFFVRNWNKTFFQLAHSHLLNSDGESINIDIMRVAIKMAKLEYDKLPKGIRKKYKKDVKQFSNWLSPTYVRSKMEIFRGLPQREKRQLLE